jgi:Putative peptidoglycan binding domain
MRRVSRRASLCLLSVTAIVASLLVSAPAYANGYYPSGCHKHAIGMKPSGWTPNCTLGQDGSKYLNYAAMVQGMQIILSGYGYLSPSGSGVDGSYGPNTLAAVKKLQKRHSLGQDGLFGPKTWTAAMSDIGFTFYLCDEYAQCWWVYDGPGAIGISRYNLLDEPTRSYPWVFIWDGTEADLGTGTPVLG